MNPLIDVCPIQSFRIPKMNSNLPMNLSDFFTASDAVLIGCLAFIFFVLLFCLLFVLHHVKLAHFLSHPEKSAFLDIIIKLRITHLNAYARDLNKRSHIKARIRTTQSNSELINAARKKNIILMNWNQLNGSQSGVQVCTFKIWPLFIVQHSEN